MTTPALALLSLALLLGVIGLVLAVRWAALGLARLADALNADAVYLEESE